MRLYNIHGQLQNKKVTKYLINWSKPSRSNLQFRVKNFFKIYWENQIVYEEFPVFGSKMKIDILNATKKIAVEVQGPQHFAFNKFFHKDSRSNYLGSIKRDLQKAQWLEKNGFSLLELEGDDLDKLSPSYLSDRFNILI